MKPKEVLNLLVVLMFVASILGVFVETVQSVNTTGWTFTGATGAATLWLLIPFLFIVGFVISQVSAMMET